MGDRPRAALAGLTALLGGACWVVKSVPILALGYQPPLLFEVAPFLFGVTLALLPSGASRHGRVSRTLGSFAAGTGLVAMVTEARGEAWGPALAASVVASCVGLLVIGLDPTTGSRPRGSVAWLAMVLGAGTVPAVLLVGGPLMLIHERLLEVPLLVVGCGWIWLGVAVLRERST